MQIAADNFQMTGAHLTKREKYSVPSLSGAYRNLLGVVPSPEDVWGIIVNWRGDFLRQSYNLLRVMGLSESQLAVMSTKVLTFTHTMWVNYGRTGANPRFEAEGLH